MNQRHLLAPSETDLVDFPSRFRQVNEGGHSFHIRLEESNGQGTGHKL